MSTTPAYSLSPITPLDVDRFASGDRVQINSQPEYGLPPARKSTRRPGSHAVLHPLSVSSATASHPEGSIIHFNEYIVSCQPITSAHISLAQYILSECEEHIAEAIITVFVKITGWRVDYYVAVHETKSIAWVAGDMADGFYGASNAKHEHEYWIHMKNFPAPYFSTPEDLQLLKNFLKSKATDLATADGSTSLLATEQIEEYLEVLNGFSGEGDVYQTYTIARFWIMIMQSMVINKGNHSWSISWSILWSILRSILNVIIHFTVVVIQHRLQNRPELAAVISPNRYGTPEARLDRFFSSPDNPPGFYHETSSRTQTSTFVDGHATVAFAVDRITRRTPLIEVIRSLVKHKCKDITSQLDLKQCSEYPFTRGGSGVIYRGALKDGTPVAIKCIELLDEASGAPTGDKAVPQAGHEIYTWSKCLHPNILPLLGMVRFRGYIAMVSPLMKNGSLPEYAKKLSLNERLQLCVQVVDVVTYLHARGMVHGDIKGANVIISDEGTPLLADFGNGILLTYTLLFSGTLSNGYSIRWTAPEIFYETSGHTAEADVYALGMTLLETLSGRLPFHEMTELGVVRNIMEGVRTPLRSSLPSGPLYESLWALFERCWMYEPTSRPSAMEVKDEIIRIIQQRDQT